MADRVIQRSGVSPHFAGGRLTVDLDALVANYLTLVEHSKPARCAAVVKANAYGLGTMPVVDALAKAGCETFFVAYADEGFTIKQAFPRSTVFVMSGFHQQSVAGIAEAGLVPVLNSLEQIDLWADYWKQRGGRRPCAIHVDTGMNRLGLTVEEALAFRSRNMSEHVVTPILVMSHLACGDNPDDPMNARQLESFQKVASVFHDVDSSFANSAGTLTGSQFLFDLTRPGIALYGAEAINDVPNPMQRVVTLEARIAQIRIVTKGETVSYGATHTLDRTTKVASACVGYGDGYPRGGSGSGVALREAFAESASGFVAGHKVPLIGRITMDVCMFDVTDVPQKDLQCGWIELIGENIPLDEAARAAGTVGYELLTSLGNRYERRYLSSGN